MRVAAWLAPLCGVALTLVVLAAGEVPGRQVSVLASPLLAVSGTEDRHATAAEARRIHAAAQEPKALWLVDGATHVDLHQFNRSGYEATVFALVTEHLRPAQ